SLLAYSAAHRIPCRAAVKSFARWVRPRFWLPLELSPYPIAFNLQPVQRTPRALGARRTRRSVHIPWYWRQMPSIIQGVLMETVGTFGVAGPNTMKKLAGVP